MPPHPKLTYPYVVDVANPAAHVLTSEQRYRATIRIGLLSCFVVRKGEAGVG